MIATRVEHLVCETIDESLKKRCRNCRNELLPMRKTIKKHSKQTQGSIVMVSLCREKQRATQKQTVLRKIRKIQPPVFIVGLILINFS